MGTAVVRVRLGCLATRVTLGPWAGALLGLISLAAVAPSTPWRSLSSLASRWGADRSGRYRVWAEVPMAPTGGFA